jgi:addiction module RelE/StbE family toxin
VEIAYSSHFLKSLSKLIKKNRSLAEKYDKRLNLFIENPFHPSLNTHKLSGYLNGYWSFTVEYDLRVVFYFSSSSKVVFAEIGTHDEVY